MGSAELGFGLGFDRVLDDANLGYYSGKRADFIVIDSNYRAHLAELARSRPALYGDLEDMLAGQYRPVYSNTGYSVYARVRDAKVGIPATRLKSTDRSMLSFIRGQICFSPGPTRKITTSYWPRMNADKRG
jgi:hypothetical protein